MFVLAAPKVWVRSDDCMVRLNHGRSGCLRWRSFRL